MQHVWAACGKTHESHTLTQAPRNYNALNLPSLSLSRSSLRLSRQMLSKTFVMLLCPASWAAAILVYEIT